MCSSDLVGITTENRIGENRGSIFSWVLDIAGGLEFKRGDEECRLHCSILAQSLRSARMVLTFLRNRRLESSCCRSLQ